SRPFFAFMRVAARQGSAAVTVAPEVAAILANIAVHGVALAEIAAHVAANGSRFRAANAKFTIGAAHLAEVAANIAIHSAALANVLPNIAAVAVKITVSTIGRSGIGRRSHGADGDQAPDRDF
ncbi:MAG: hypothetical protein WAM15_08510, partial [Candidatus Acidiferrales bacterium]